jgi:hypothetical protein
MSVWQSFKSLWKSTDDTQPEIVDKTVLNVSTGNFLIFSYTDFEGISEQSLELKSKKDATFQSGKKLSYFKLGLEGMFYRALSEDEIEIMRPLSDMDSFLGLVGDDFNEFMNIDEDEFSVDGSGNEVINSNEKSFELSDDLSWLQKGKYFLTHDEAETEFDSMTCRFSRLRTMDKKRVITIAVEPNSGSTSIYESVVLPSYSIKEMY